MIQNPSTSAYRILAVEVTFVTFLRLRSVFFSKRFLQMFNWDANHNLIFWVAIDPDITWGDGIYSAYFTQLGSNPGFFTVSAYVDDNRGQAVVPIHTNITRGHLGN